MLIEKDSQIGGAFISVIEKGSIDSPIELKSFSDFKARFIEDWKSPEDHAPPKDVPIMVYSVFRKSWIVLPDVIFWNDKVDVDCWCYMYTDMPYGSFDRWMLLPEIP